MDRRTILALILCFLIYMGWEKYYIEPRMPKPQNPAAQTTSPPAAPEAEAPPATMAPVSPHLQPQKTLVMRFGTGNAVLGDGSDVFVGWDLKNYKLGLAAQAAAVDLHSVTNENGELSLQFDDPALGYLGSVRGTLTRAPDDSTLWTYEDSNVRLTRKVSGSAENPAVSVDFTAEFKKAHPKYAFVSLTSQYKEKDPEARDRQLAYFTNDSIERAPMKESISMKDVITPVHYIASTNRYFVLAAIAGPPSGTEAPKGLVQPIAPNQGRISLVYAVNGNSISLPVRTYFGPKEIDLMRSVDPKLDHTVDFGWFTIFAYPLLKILKWLFQFVHNYGAAIILLTLLLKIVTYPLAYKSMKSMKEMAKIQPQLQRVREKYKDDREALNREMMTLMRSHGYNPMAGCLPVLIQTPIFIALYRVLYSSIDLYHAPFMFWIHDLSVRDPYYVTPILLAVLMWLQQKISPSTATDPTQQKMMQLMPLMFGFFMMGLPAGLTLYMLVNSIASIFQQMILNKKLDIRHASSPASAR